MHRILNNFRFVSWVAIFCSLCGSLLMFIIGAMKTLNAFRALFLGIVPKESLSHLKPADIATTYLIKSVDAFLIALVLFIFAYGVHSLFISGKREEDTPGVLKWITMPSISYLKNVLAEVIIIILIVRFLEVALIALDLEPVPWEVLTLPVSVLLLAVGLRFLGLREESSRNQGEDEST